MVFQKSQCIIGEINYFLVPLVPLETNQNGPSNQFFT